MCFCFCYCLCFCLFLFFCFCLRFYLCFCLCFYLCFHIHLLLFDVYQTLLCYSITSTLQLPRLCHPAISCPIGIHRIASCIWIQHAVFVRYARVVFYVTYCEHSKIQKGYGSGWSGTLCFCGTYRFLALSVTKDATSSNDDSSSQLMLSISIPKDAANNFSACPMLNLTPSHVPP